MARTRIALVLLLLTAALLLPRPAAAQDQKPGCDVTKIFSGLGSTLLGIHWLEERVSVEGTTLRLMFCSPPGQAIVADEKFKLAKRALVELAALTDVPLDGGYDRLFYLDADQLLRTLGARGAIDRQDRVYLGQSSLNRTVVHEIAHYWADSQRFPEPWMVEAYAEYLTSLAMQRLGEPYTGGNPPTLCDGRPLIAWRPSGANEDICPYTAGRQVFEDLAALAGEDTLRRVIGEITRAYGTVNSQRLLRELEQASGANLSPVMRGRVFGSEDDGWLGERVAVHDRYNAAAARAASVGASLPAAIGESLRGWRNDEVLALLGQLEPVLAAVENTSGRCEELELSCARPWEQALADLSAWPGLDAFLAGAPQVLSSYEGLRVNAAALGLGIPEALRQQAGTLSQDALPALARAAEVLAAVSGFEARCSQLQLGCRATWDAPWERGELEDLARTVGRLSSAFDGGLALEERCADLRDRCRELWMQALYHAGPAGVETTARELNELLSAAASVEERCGGVAARCRQVWHDELRRSAPADAAAVVRSLTRLLAKAEALAERCGPVAESCRRLWQGEFTTGTIAGTTATIEGLERLLDRGAELEESCQEAGWPCEGGWRAVLAAGDPTHAGELLEQQAAALPELRDLRARVAAGCCVLGLRVSGAADPLAGAREKFASGDVAGAVVQAREAERVQSQQRMTLTAWIAFAVTAIVAVVALLVVARGRRARLAASPTAVALATPSAGPLMPSTAAPPTSDNDLLARLLDVHPEEPRAYDTKHLPGGEHSKGTHT